MTVREATPADAERLIGHMQQLLSEEHVDIPLAPNEFVLTVEEERELLAAYNESDNSIFLLAEAGSDLVGQLNLKGSKRKALAHSAVLGMSVHRTWRNKGVGSALIGKALAWARHGGVLKRIELYVYARNQPAIHLYEKFGFQVEGRRQKVIYQGGEYLDDLIMAILL